MIFMIKRLLPDLDHRDGREALSPQQGFCLQQAVDDCKLAASGADDYIAITQAASCIVLSSTILRRRVMAGSLSTTVSPTLLPTRVLPMGDDMLTCPSSNSTESPKTRL